MSVHYSMYLLVTALYLAANDVSESDLAIEYVKGRQYHARRLSNDAVSQLEVANTKWRLGSWSFKHVPKAQGLIGGNGNDKTTVGRQYPG